MKIALDAMGGDRGPRPAVEGAVLAARKYKVDVALVGNPRNINRLLKVMKALGEPHISVVEATDVITMKDSPRQTLKRKNSSLAIAVDMVKRGEADAMISAGNTGAVLAHCLFSWRTIPGIKKPAIATMLPTLHDAVVIVDAGANVDCKPRQLVSFAMMGSEYARVVLHRKAPRVGLLSNGEEESKGNEAVLEAHQLLKQADLNFRGNAEGRDVFSGEFDVISCDGFVGNVLLKASEGLASIMFKALKAEAQKSLVTTLGGLAMKPAARRLKRRTDYDEYGGAPLLGVNGVSIIAHGRSNTKAYANAIRVAKECVERDLVGHLKEKLKDLEEIAGPPDDASSGTPASSEGARQVAG